VEIEGGHMQNDKDIGDLRVNEGEGEVQIRVLLRLTLFAEKRQRI